MWLKERLSYVAVIMLGASLAFAGYQAERYYRSTQVVIKKTKKTQKVVLRPTPIPKRMVVKQRKPFSHQRRMGRRRVVEMPLSEVEVRVHYSSRPLTTHQVFWLYSGQGYEVGAVTPGWFHTADGRDLPVGRNLVGAVETTARYAGNKQRPYFTFPKPGKKSPLRFVSSWQTVRASKKRVNAVEMGPRLVPFKSGGFSNAWRNRSTDRFAIGFTKTKVKIIYDRTSVAKLRTHCKHEGLIAAASPDGGSSAYKTNSHLVFVRRLD